jgi:hypothetical protein
VKPFTPQSDLDELNRAYLMAGKAPARKVRNDAALDYALREYRTCRRLGSMECNARVVAIVKTARQFGLWRETVRAMLAAALAERRDDNTQAQFLGG